MKWALRIFFGVVLIAMLIVTTWASLDKNVFEGGALVMAEPWGVATLFDTYFAFLTFYLWVLYKESGWIARILWFVAILLLGNFAMAFYALIQIQKSPDDSMEGILLRKPATNSEE